MDKSIEDKSIEDKIDEIVQAATAFESERGELTSVAMPRFMKRVGKELAVMIFTEVERIIGECSDEKTFPS